MSSSFFNSPLSSSSSPVSSSSFLHSAFPPATPASNANEHANTPTTSLMKTPSSGLARLTLLTPSAASVAKAKPRLLSPDAVRRPPQPQIAHSVENGKNNKNMNGPSNPSPPSTLPSNPSSRPPLCVSSSLLHGLVSSSLAGGDHAMAAFFMDKLATINNNTQQWLEYADCLVQSRQYRRALHLLSERVLKRPQGGPVELNSLQFVEDIDYLYLKALFLCARCHFESGQYDEALSCLGDDSCVLSSIERFLSSGIDERLNGDGAQEEKGKENVMAVENAEYYSNKPSSSAVPASAIPSHSSSSPFATPLGAQFQTPKGDPAAMATSPKSAASPAAASSPAALARISLPSLMSSHRALIYEHLQNRGRAVYWYRQALVWDAKNTSAFFSLMDKRMLSYGASLQFLDELYFPDEFLWLRLLYENKLYTLIHTQETSAIILNNVELLENEYGLMNNIDICVSVGENLYIKEEFSQCYQLTKKLLLMDPYHANLLPIHIACLMELKLNTELYYMAHQLMDSFPSRSISWYAVGCYYFATHKFEMARRYFHKATRLDNFFAPAWIAFGHAFAMQDESDQAMLAYRTAARLFEGHHIPLLCIGMEYLKTNNLIMAEQCFKQTYAINPTDPLTLNELGVIAYSREEYPLAIEYFTAALDYSNRFSTAIENIYINIGHAYRKNGEYERAVSMYEKALAKEPEDGSLLSAMGFTQQLLGRLSVAIQFYHRALGLNPRDSFTAELLAKALEEAADEPID